MNLLTKFFLIICNFPSYVCRTSSNVFSLTPDTDNLSPLCHTCIFLAWGFSILLVFSKSQLLITVILKFLSIAYFITVFLQLFGHIYVREVEDTVLILTFNWENRTLSYSSWCYPVSTVFSSVIAVILYSI